MDYLQYEALVSVYQTSNTVLNLVINGLPSILNMLEIKELVQMLKVLNLVINGLPSILHNVYCVGPTHLLGFKPCYKWITFNTSITMKEMETAKKKVLNLVINGLPSILYISIWIFYTVIMF